MRPDGVSDTPTQQTHRYLINDTQQYRDDLSCLLPLPAFKMGFGNRGIPHLDNPPQSTSMCFWRRSDGLHLTIVLDPTDPVTHARNRVQNTYKSCGHVYDLVRLLSSSLYHEYLD